jgi:hypothetical protein
MARWPALLAAALLLAGCGSSNDDDRDPLAGKGRPASDVKAPKDSAEAEALRAWRLFQDSNWPSLVGEYDPKVPETLGASDMMNAMSMYSGDLQTAPLLVSGSYPAADGTVVTLTMRYAGKPYKVSYLMKRSDGGTWRILYDSFLARAVSTYVEAESRALEGRDEDQPSSLRTRRAANEAARVYRDIFLDDAGHHRLFRRAVSAVGDQDAEGTSDGP